MTDVRVSVCVGKGQSEQEIKKGYETDNMAHLFYVATQTLSAKPKTKSAVFSLTSFECNIQKNYIAILKL